MSGTPVSGDYRRHTLQDDHVAELSWMREHHRSAEWIDAALERDLHEHGRVGSQLCHAIGEHLGPHPDSPLGEFVVYDILRPRAVLDQLRDSEVASAPTAWRDALAGFCEDAMTRGWESWVSLDSPRPMLYVSRASCPVGAWVDMTRPERAVDDALAALPGDHRETGWVVSGRMGFYDVYPLAQPELWTMHVIGQGIDRHGEAFAAYAEHTFQQAMSEHDFEARYRGQVRTLDEFVHAQAEERGWLDALARLREVDGLAGAVTVDMDALSRHIFSTGYAYEPGRRGFHIFGPRAF